MCRIGTTRNRFHRINGKILGIPSVPKTGNRDYRVFSIDLIETIRKKNKASSKRKNTVLEQFKNGPRIYQQLAKFLYRGSDSKYFIFCMPYGLCSKYTYLQLQHKNTHRQYINE